MDIKCKHTHIVYAADRNFFFSMGNISEKNFLIVLLNKKKNKNQTFNISIILVSISGFYTEKITETQKSLFTLLALEKLSYHMIP